MDLSKLSAKNQVTLPKHARDKAGILVDGEAFVIPYRTRHAQSEEDFSVLRVMNEVERKLREQRILEQAPPEERETLLIQFSGLLHRMAVDGHGRIVLPAGCVSHLHLDREVCVFESNNTLLLWHPEDWQRYSDAKSTQTLAGLLF